MFTTKVLSRTITLVTVFVLALSSVHPAFAAPSNDNFADAATITSLPYSVTVDTTDATVEGGEPYPSCGYGYNPLSVWYSYTSAADVSLTASTIYQSFPPVMAVYTGSFGSLSEISCGSFGSQRTFQAQAGETYYFQLSSIYDFYQGAIPFTLQVTPPPQISFYYSPGDPNIFDTITFYSNASDPGGIGIETYAWTTSDGGTSDQYSFDHQFAADGDYTVSLTATTYDGRSATGSQIVQVRTKDIAITTFAVPQTARVNQTKTININVQNKRYSDYVQVTLLKGLPGGGEVVIGTLTIYVPAKARQATTFKFSYTFTADDAKVGKVTFRAEAHLVNGRDALPADNVSIATTSVSR